MECGYCGSYRHNTSSCSMDFIDVIVDACCKKKKKKKRKKVKSKQGKKETP